MYSVVVSNAPRGAAVRRYLSPALTSKVVKGSRTRFRNFCGGGFSGVGSKGEDTAPGVDCALAFLDARASLVGVDTTSSNSSASPSASLMRAFIVDRDGVLVIARWRDGGVLYGLTLHTRVAPSSEQLASASALLDQCTTFTPSAWPESCTDFSLGLATFHMCTL